MPSSTRHGQHPAGVGIERRLPELFGAHLAQALEPADGPGALFHALVDELLLDPRQLLPVERIELAGRLALPLPRDVDAEERRLGDEHVAALDQPREVPEKERQEQHLDVRPVDVRVGEDDQLPVAQIGKVDRVLQLVVVDPDRERDRLDLLVGVQRVGAVLPGVLRLALERQDRLEFLVARLLRRSARRIAFDDEELVAVGVVGCAVGELAGQHCNTRDLAAFDLLRRLGAGERLPDRELGDPLALVDVRVEPQLERIANHLGDELHPVARDQLVLHLPLELRVEHLHREDVARARPDVLRDDLQPALAHRVVVDEVPDGGVHTLAQARHVGPPEAGRDHVDVGLGDDVALRCPGDRPHRTFALGEAVGFRLRVDVALAEERLRDWIEATDGSGEVALDPFWEVPSLGLDLALLLDPERELDPGQQHRFGAQQRRDVRDYDLRRVEVLWIGPEPHARPALARPCGANLLQRLLDLAVVGEHQPVARAVAGDLDLDALRQRVGHAHPDPVQPARDPVRGVLVGLPELAARVKCGEDHLHRRDLLLRVDVDRDSAAVVDHLGRAVLVQGHRDLLREPGEALVSRVVDDLDQRVIRIDRVGVHPRPVEDRRQILEDLDVFGAIGPRFRCHFRACP